MALLEDAVLSVHIAAGFLALGAGGGALLTRKGGHRHRQSGRVYVVGMAVVSVTALVLLGLEQSIERILLGLIAVFSFYFAFSGYRVLSRKRPVDTPTTVDWVAVGCFGAAGVGMLGTGLWLLTDGIDFGIVLLVFAGISLFVTGSDLRQFRVPVEDPRAWFFEHITRMGGAYIATVTAFASVNATFLPELARWLVPTVVGSVAIWYVSRNYQRKFDGSARPEDN